MKITNAIRKEIVSIYEEDENHIQENGAVVARDGSLLGWVSKQGRGYSFTTEGAVLSDRLKENAG